MFIPMGLSCSHNNYNFLDVDPKLYSEHYYRYQAANVQCQKCSMKLRAIRHKYNDEFKDWYIPNKKMCDHKIKNIDETSTEITKRQLLGNYSLLIMLLYGLEGAAYKNTEEADASCVKCGEQMRLQRTFIERVKNHEKIPENKSGWQIAYYKTI